MFTLGLREYRFRFLPPFNISGSPCPRPVLDVEAHRVGITEVGRGRVLDGLAAMDLRGDIDIEARHADGGHNVDSPERQGAGHAHLDDSPHPVPSPHARAATDAPLDA